MKRNDYFVRKALDLALMSKKEGNEPFGAILVKGNKIVAYGKNKTKTYSDPTYHAEAGLIRDFCHHNKITSLKDYNLYTSCEPCAMCAAAMVWAQLGKIIYSVTHKQLSRIAGNNMMVSCKYIFKKSPHKPKLIEKVLNKEGLKVFDNYTFKK